MRKVKLCVIVTDPICLWSLYRDQFEFLMNEGFEITAIASSGVEHEMLKKRGIKSVPINMKKQPSLFLDLISLIRLIFFLSFNRFDVISVSTPKASLLGAIAARMTFQKKISFMLRGRVYENMKGKKRILFEFVDKLICALADSVISVSHEMKSDFIVKKICSEKKIEVIGLGSSNGVDLTRFTPNDFLFDRGLGIRESLGIQNGDVLFLYSGRIRRDKGIVEMIEAFSLLRKEFSNVHLLVQGKVDVIDQLPSKTVLIMKNDPNIHQAGWCFDVEKYFSAADIFVFPSHREGFGNVAIEASAMELPVIAFDVMGCRESVSDNVSGVLVNEVDSYLLFCAMRNLLIDTELRKKLGKQGRKRVKENFDSLFIWSELAMYYKKLAVRDR